MDEKIMMIKSDDNTDTIIFIDKIQYIIEKNGYIEIGLRDNVKITTQAKFSDIEKIFERCGCLL